MNKMSKRIKRMIAILVTVLMISQLPGVGYIISGAADDPVVPEPVGTLTYTCTAEDEGRIFSMFYQSLATLIVPEDLGVTIGGVEITDSVNAGASFTINNGGYIGTANIQYGQVYMNGGTYTSITLAEGATINATGITATSSITSSGSFSVEGNNVSNGSVTAVSIGGSGNIAVMNKLELTGTGTTATLLVYTDTQIINSTGAAFTVTHLNNNKEYNIPAGTNSTLREMYGVEVDCSSVDGNATCTAGSDQLNTPILHGDSTEAITFTAADGYCFLDDYQAATDGTGTVTTTVVDKNTITVTYTVGTDDEGIVTINLPELSKLPVGTGELTVDNIRYMETVNPQITSSTNDDSSPLFEYKQVDADDSTYTTTKPTLVGYYVVRVTLPANKDYYTLVLEKEFSILRAVGSAEFSVADIIYGETVNPQVTSSTHDKEAAVIEYKLVGAAESEYSTTVPTAVGDYDARATLAANESYEQVVKTTTFSITKAKGAMTLVVENIIYGGVFKPQITSDTNDETAAVVEYKVAESDDSTYTTQAFTAVGNYMVRVILAENESYEQVVDTAEFSILKAQGSAEFSVADVKYNEVINPVVTSSTHDVSTAVIEYKSVGSEDTEYSEDKPTAVGDYVARVTLPENASYQQVVKTTTFSVEKADGNGTINVNNVFYGATVSPELSSGTNDIYMTLVEYKVTGADDSTYSREIPTAVGNYTARVTYAENDSYNQVVVTDEFTISYLPAPAVAVVLSGTEGSNGYYTTAVTISAPAGYLVSDRLDGEYATSITFDSTWEAGYLYYKNIQTGEKTTGVWQDEIMIDQTLPSITADNGTTYYAEFVEIAIEDANLCGITVNGEIYADIVGGKATLRLESKNGLEEYEIVITDMAGNTKVMMVIVADNWMEQGVIPTGENVSLMVEYEYSLGDGIWQVEGDETSYNGNTSFYVRTEGKYTFVQQ